MQKLVDQLHMDSATPEDKEQAMQIPEERATLLFLIDTYSKHLIEVEHHPVRKVRETLDGFAKELLSQDDEAIEKTLFRFRQFFSSYRIDEYTYTQKTIDDLRHIILQFVDQLSQDLSDERKEDLAIKSNLDQLKEAAESNSIDVLKASSKKFIDTYVQSQGKKVQRKAKRMDSIKKNLDTVKKQLVDANNSMRLDHLTQAFNRKSFDEQLKHQWNLHQMDHSPVSLIMLDIDHFKKINDSYGHPMGDFILVECVKMLKEIFPREVDFVARVGGEEFAIILPSFAVMHAVKKAEDVLSKIRHEVFINGDLKLQFTVSLGIAQLEEGETTEQWMKRADEALYVSKNTGRNKYTVAPSSPHKEGLAS